MAFSNTRELVSISGLVLAGGQSRRMRSASDPDADKGLLAWRGRALAARACDFMRAQGLADVKISANRNQHRYARFAPVLPDAPEFIDCGPLAGVLAGLLAARHEQLLVLPVDNPCWPQELLDALRGAPNPERAPLYLRASEFSYPLCLLLERAHAASLQAYLRAGSRRVYGWLQNTRAKAVALPEGVVLANLNRPEDMR